MKVKLFLILTGILAGACGAEAASCSWTRLPFGGPRVCIPVAGESQQAPNQCAALYQHGNFGGKRWVVMGDNASVSGKYISRRRWRGHLRGYTGRDVNWNDKLSSLRVAPGCRITLFEHSNYRGHRTVYEGTNQVLSVRQVRHNDSMTSYKCHCTNSTMDIGYVL